MTEITETQEDPQGHSPKIAHPPTIHRSLHEMAIALAQVINNKDEYTNGHSFRVARYTQLLAEELGYDENTIDKYSLAALLHDLGKISTPDYILTKDTDLTEDEFKKMQEHTLEGYKILRIVQSVPELALAAKYHHERPDGKGYPEGLRGSQIPRVAQLVAVADSFDAMFSDRPYRGRMNYQVALANIRNGAGTQFAEDVVKAFLRLDEKGLLSECNNSNIDISSLRIRA